MNDDSHEYGGAKANPALDAFRAAQISVSPQSASLPDTVPFDATLGEEVARQVLRDGITSRINPVLNQVDPQAVAHEPEEVGGRGSRMRRCIVTGEVLPQDQMIRFVVDPQGVIMPDLEAKLPTRGYWVTARHNEIYRAIAADAFSRAARAKVIVPAALMDQVIILARRACLSTLGLARRAWQIEFGHDKVRQALVSKKVGVLLIASNAPTDIQNRLDGVRGDITTINLFNTSELSAALGRESLVFAAVNKGQWTVRLLIETNRLAQLLAR